MSDDSGSDNAIGSDGNWERVKFEGESENPLAPQNGSSNKQPQDSIKRPSRDLTNLRDDIARQMQAGAGNGYDKKAIKLGEFSDFQKQIFNNVTHEDTRKVLGIAKLPFSFAWETGSILSSGFRDWATEQHKDQGIASSLFAGLIMGITAPESFAKEEEYFHKGKSQGLVDLEPEGIFRKPLMDAAGLRQKKSDPRIYDAIKENAQYYGKQINGKNGKIASLLSNVDIKADKNALSPRDQQDFIAATMGEVIGQTIKRGALSPTGILKHENQLYDLTDINEFGKFINQLMPKTSVQNQDFDFHLHKPSQVNAAQNNRQVIEDMFYNSGMSIDDFIQMANLGGKANSVGEVLIVLENNDDSEFFEQLANKILLYNFETLFANQADNAVNSQELNSLKTSIGLYENDYLKIQTNQGTGQKEIKFERSGRNKDLTIEQMAILLDTLNQKFPPAKTQENNLAQEAQKAGSALRDLKVKSTNSYSNITQQGNKPLWQMPDKNAQTINK